MGNFSKSQRNRLGVTVRRVLWVAAASASAAVMNPASAQQAPAPTMQLEEIVVTARKREESLQDTPIAISAFTAAALERQEISTTADLSSVAPNLQFKAYGPLTGNNAAAQVFIRGIGQTDGSSGVDPGVGLYIDEVYMGRSVGGVMEFRDVSGVQVLRGPQGTLFGRNTIGGAVLLSTTLPGNELGGSARIAVGDDRLREAFAALDVPMGDKLAARFSVGARKRDGYVTRVYDGLDLGDENTMTLQTTWQLHATDNLTFTLRGDYTKNDEHGSPFVFAAVNGSQAFPAAASKGAGCPGATFPPPSVPSTLVDSRCANNATWNLGPFTNGGTAPAESNLKNWGTSLVASWKLNDVLSLKSISAYRNLEWAGKRDADNTGLLILHTDYQSDGHQFSQELQALVGTDKLHGVVGAYYFKESVEDFLQVPYAAPPPAVAAGSPGSRDYQDAKIDNDNTALFTQWTYDILPGLSATGGLRYTEENKGIQVLAFTTFPLTTATIIPTVLRPYTVAADGSVSGSNVLLPGSNTYGLHVLPDPFKNTYKSTTGSASVQYRWNEDFMTYASFSQGFKSGGFNQRFNGPTLNYIPISFNPEKANTFEIGFKSQFGGDLRFNGAVFHTKYTDMQLIYRLSIVPIIYNAGEATIEGGELELTYAPGSLIIESSLGFLRNSFDEIKNFPSATATVNPNNTLPFTPKLQGNIGIGYAFAIGSEFKLTPHANVSYTGSQYFDAANSPEVAQLDNVTTVNASLTFANESAKWQIKAGVNNLTDKLYPVAGNSSYGTSAGYAEIIYARPRNFYLSGSLKF